ncbi:hypothetical protein [Archangium sp.]|uniref:hypothetical protein n=1 Tax=Archangium sp. TaxID=1872627 RepID=UPI002D56762F|nr:hypothetical protein [Archangium sp.]HYO56285.1 hypothetical protein [Archangium sp.]
MKKILPNFVLLSSVLVLGCSGANPHVRVHRAPEGYLQVDGPLAGPYETLESLSESACEILTSEPGAMNGKYGFEYCALYYYSSQKNAFFLSYLSDFSQNFPNGTKRCTVPRSLSDPIHKDALVLGDAHNHPHNPALSEPDVQADKRWKPSRIADSSGRVWDRSTLMFFRDKYSGRCNVVFFNNRTLVISALRNRKWIEIGKVVNDQGHIQIHDGMDWLPEQ